VVSTVGLDAPPLNMELLRLNVTFIQQVCVDKHDRTEFVYGDLVLDGLMLSKAGISPLDGRGSLVNICSDCEAALKRGTIPKYALKNNLYRGRLPECFHDLTWVEEMVVCFSYY
jgi:hypothetical protein